MYIATKSRPSNLIRPIYAAVHVHCLVRASTPVLSSPDNGKGAHCRECLPLLDARHITQRQQSYKHTISSIEHSFSLTSKVSKVAAPKVRSTVCTEWAGSAFTLHCLAGSTAPVCPSSLSAVWHSSSILYRHRQHQKKGAKKEETLLHH